AAGQRDTLVLAELSRARQWQVRQIQSQVNIVGHEKIRPAIAVVVEKCTAGIPAAVAARHTGLFRPIGKSAVMIVALKLVFSVIGHKEVIVAIVVIISGTSSLSPAAVSQPRLLSNVVKSSITVV